MTECLSRSCLSQLSEFVADRMGLHFPRERWLDLERGMRAAALAFEFEEVEPCVQWLISAPVTRRQIEILASHLSVGETYFFRERQTFDVLEARVLPELINCRRGTDRRLRIWSAGCCTGDEPYSIAILLKGMLPDWENWQITVLATDINPHFLRKAVEGVYGEWSFRGASAEYKEKYFVKRPNGGYELLPEIKRIVTFSYLNLMEDAYPSLLNNTSGMDIIFCRNVLMYFDSARAKQVVRKLHLSLADNGWLIVSPCETSNVLFAQFATINFPGAILYKKAKHTSVGLPSGIEAPIDFLQQSMPAIFFGGTPETQITVAEPPAKPIRIEATEPQRAKSEETLYDEPLRFYEQGRYEEAAVKLLTLLAQDPRDAKAAALLARVYANQGKLDEASRCSEQAVAADRLNPSCHMLQATILQEQGAILEAARALQRALYLEPNLILAHFALGNIARRQEKLREAARHFANARALLGAYTPEQVLPEFEGMTAGRLMEIIRSIHGDPLSAAAGERSVNSSAFVPDGSLRKGMSEGER
jgi:chemotaxis protein methyltransferase CheR